MLERQTSHTMKVYEEGSFHEGNNGRDAYSNNMVKQNNINRKATSKAANDNNFDHGYHSGSGRSMRTASQPADRDHKSIFKGEHYSF